MEQFNRTELLIGANNLNKLKHSHVAIFGLGGVGGYVCEMLARAGVGTLSIIDFDIVDKTNINRQIIALHSTVGRAKTDVMKERILAINPNCVVHIINEKYEESNSELFFDNSYDFVVDAIDMVKSKVHLITTCINKNIPIISAMGAGNRMDIPHFEVCDIYKTYNDGLAKVLRKKLKENNIKHHNVVYSSSKACPCGDTIGSISYYPAMCGCVLSSYVLQNLLNILE